MANYILTNNKQGSKRGCDYEVHNLNTCTHLPNIINQVSLGDFTDCISAVAYAKLRYANNSSEINGCYWCCNQCHTK